MTYNLCLTSDFAIPQVKTVLKELKSIGIMALINLSLIPEEIGYKDSLEKFKTKIRRWEPNDYLCHICKTYIPNVEFLEIFE